MFILIVSIVGTVELFSFKDPSITQYRIFDWRNDGTELNLGENHASFFFALQDKNIKMIKIDPRYVSFKLQHMRLFTSVENGELLSELTDLSVDEYT